MFPSNTVHGTAGAVTRRPGMAEQKLEIKLGTKCRVTSKGASNAIRTITRVLDDPAKVTVSWTDAKGGFHERDEWVKNLEADPAPVAAPTPVKPMSPEEVSKFVHSRINPMPAERGTILQGEGGNGREVLTKALQTECEVLRAKAANAYVEVTFHKNKVSALEGKISGKDAVIAALNSTVGELQDKVADLQNKVKSADATAKQESDVSVAASALFASVSKDYEAKKGALAHVTAQYDALLTERVQFVAEIKRRFSPGTAVMFAGAAAVAGLIVGGLFF